MLQDHRLDLLGQGVVRSQLARPTLPMRPRPFHTLYSIAGLTHQTPTYLTTDRAGTLSYLSGNSPNTQPLIQAALDLIPLL